MTSFTCFEIGALTRLLNCKTFIAKEIVSDHKLSENMTRNQDVRVRVRVVRVPLNISVPRVLLFPSYNLSSSPRLDITILSLLHKFPCIVKKLKP